MPAKADDEKVYVYGNEHRANDFGIRSGEYIRQRFFQPKRHKKGKVRGQGLFIVKDLVNRYDGEIHVQSSEKRNDRYDDHSRKWKKMG
ncbi:hypothetical protein RCO48_39840 [Peribacillus frigoritolerans]|nr:hypothetical protein [Peribacillus frigoritolerans]